MSIIGKSASLLRRNGGGFDKWRLARLRIDRRRQHRTGTPVGTANLWYDPCGFVLPSLGFLGTAGRNSLRGDGLDNVDFSVVKDTRLKLLGESGRLEFRAEIFNLFNHANFATPEVGVADSPNAAVVFPGSTLVSVKTEAPLTTAGALFKTSTSSRQIQFALKILF